MYAFSEINIYLVWYMTEKEKNNSLACLLKQPCSNFFPENALVSMQNAHYAQLHANPAYTQPKSVVSPGTVAR